MNIVDILKQQAVKRKRKGEPTYTLSINENDYEINGETLPPVNFSNFEYACSAPIRIRRVFPLENVRYSTGTSFAGDESSYQTVVTPDTVTTKPY